MVDEENTLEVRGAILCYKVRGTGPVLLIIQRGAGDADGSARLADGLVDAYTVVTYDRRGLSRSTLTDESNHPTHARVEETFHREGAAAAMGKMLADAGAGFHDREPDLELPNAMIKQWPGWRAT
jgi:hypothetical protein